MDTLVSFPTGTRDLTPGQSDSKVGRFKCPIDMRFLGFFHRNEEGCSLRQAVGERSLLRNLSHSAAIRNLRRRPNRLELSAQGRAFSVAGGWSLNRTPCRPPAP